MTPSKMKRLALGAALLASVAAADVAHAQYGANQAYREDASSALARHIRTLASDPRNVYALIGAGNAALEVGDTQAALAFLGRAEEASPRNGQVKAAMGSAFVQTEQPQAALKMFAEAASLGVAAPLMAKDRGLAYDMIGDPVQAQADYRLALQRSPDPEVERRLALSRAISGDRAGALAAIDAQLRRHDKAAWRTRAFVLALTGDTAEAMKSAQANMPAARAAELQPFFARLPQLSSADKALAVHFGHFPQDARYAAVQPVQLLSPQTARQPERGSSATTAGRPDARQQSLGRRSTAQVASVAPSAVAPPAAAAAVPKVKSEQPRVRRSRIDPRDPMRFRMRELEEREAREAQAAARARQQAQAQLQQQPQLALAPRPAPVQQQAPVSIMPSASAAPAPGSGITASESVSAGVTQSIAPQMPVATAPIVSPSFNAQGASAQSSQQGNFGLTPDSASMQASPSTLPVVVESAQLTASSAAPVADTQTSTTAGGIRFADVAAAIASLPVNDAPDRAVTTEPKREAVPAKPKPEAKPPSAKATQPKKPEPAAKPVQAKKAEPAAKQATAKKAEPAAKEPSRIWVQLAAAQNKAAFPGEFKRFKAKAPKLLANQSAWTAPLGASNRLLIGPFKTAKEAKDLVNELAKVQISSYSWTSEAGEAVSKIPAK